MHCSRNTIEALVAFLVITADKANIITHSDSQTPYSDPQASRNLGKLLRESSVIP